MDKSVDRNKRPCRQANGRKARSDTSIARLRSCVSEALRSAGVSAGEAAAMGFMAFWVAYFAIQCFRIGA